MYLGPPPAGLARPRHHPHLPRTAGGRPGRHFRLAHRQAPGRRPLPPLLHRHRTVPHRHAQVHCHLGLPEALQEGRGQEVQGNGRGLQILSRAQVPHGPEGVHFHTYPSPHLVFILMHKLTIRVKNLKGLGRLVDQIVEQGGDLITIMEVNWKT